MFSGRFASQKRPPSLEGDRWIGKLEVLTVQHLKSRRRDLIRKMPGKNEVHVESCLPNLDGKSTLMDFISLADDAALRKTTLPDELVGTATYGITTGVDNATDGQ